MVRTEIDTLKKAVAAVKTAVDKKPPPVPQPDVSELDGEAPRAES